MAHRDIIRNARRDLHSLMKVPAVYIEYPGAPARAITARPQLESRPLGDMAGTNFHYSEREEAIPRLRLVYGEVGMPSRGAVVNFGAGEAYLIDHCLPPDGEFITAIVSVVPRAEALSLPAPEA